MLEVDEDSRLGREMLAEGGRYGASAAPTEDETAAWYAAACTWLESAGVHQYEISNFARAGHTSRHNTKYWRRQPYLGFGLDAHSMLRRGPEALRRANTDDLDTYLHQPPQSPPTGLQVITTEAAPKVDLVRPEQGFEEALFLGLRMNEGVDLADLRTEFGDGLVRCALEATADVEQAGLLSRIDGRLQLTAQGRMVSNEVFSRLLLTPA
jgi:oxygen-independent coproporphyrinogen-3 oxidase